MLSEQLSLASRASSEALLPNLEETMALVRHVCCDFPKFFSRMCAEIRCCRAVPTATLLGFAFGPF